MPNAPDNTITLKQQIQLPYEPYMAREWTESSSDTSKFIKARIDAPNYHRSAGLLVCVSCEFNDPESVCNRFDFPFDEGFVCDDWQPRQGGERAADYVGDDEDDEERQHKGGMIALFLQEDAAKQLEAPGFGNSVAASDMHITLAHFKVDPTDEQMEMLKALISSIANEQGEPIAGKIEAVTTFPPGDDGAPLIALVDSAQMPGLRQRVMAGVEAIGIEPSMDHGFIPHITLAYLQNNTDHSRQASAIGTELMFGDLSLVAGGRLEFSAPFEEQRLDLIKGVTTTAQTNGASAHGITPEAANLVMSILANEVARANGEEMNELPLMAEAAKAGARHNRKDKGALQKIHDFTVSMGGAKCETLEGQGKNTSFTKLADAVFAEVNRQFIQPLREELEDNEWIDSWIAEFLDDNIIVGVNDSREPGEIFWSYPYEVTGDNVVLGEAAEFERIFRPITPLPETDATRSVTKFQDLPLADREREWDGDAARQRIRKWAGGPDKEDIDLGQFRRAFFWRDDDKPESLRKSYKLPYGDIVEGKLVAVPNGIIAAAGILAGARGGTDVPDADQETIKNQVSRYYAKMRKTFDDDTLIPTWEQPERDEKTIPLSNALKAVSRTDDQLIVENAIVLFGGRDLVGTVAGPENPDGSRGEFFTKDTQLESAYTKAVGRLPVDWEHSLYEDRGEPGHHDILGFVDWATAKATPDGLFVQRVLDRRNQYVRMLEELIDEGLIGTSSEAIPEKVQKGADGALLVWPLMRDTLTVAPMEPRMSKEFGDNILAKIKALVDQGVVKEIAAGSKACSAGGGRPSQEQAKTRLRLKSKQIELNQ